MFSPGSVQTNRSFLLSFACTSRFRVSISVNSRSRKSFMTSFAPDLRRFRGKNAQSWTINQQQSRKFVAVVASREAGEWRQRAENISPTAVMQNRHLDNGTRVLPVDYRWHPKGSIFFLFTIAIYKLSIVTIGRSINLILYRQPASKYNYPAFVNALASASFVNNKSFSYGILATKQITKAVVPKLLDTMI